MPPTNSLHAAFGLTIESDVPLPELSGGEGRADVRIRFAPLSEETPATGGWKVTASESEVRGWIPGGGGFLVRNGSEIVLDPASGHDERALRLAILGPLLGVILSQRGRFVLHASTVAIEGRAVAFTGPSGRGKSTLTAAMTQAGHTLVADDMTVIDFVEGRPFVQPGFARVKLWPDSAAALDHDIETLPLVHPEVSKRSLGLAGQFRAEPLPLSRCYLLEDGDRELSESVSPSRGVMSLIAFTYQAAWMQQTGTAGANLLRCADLVRSGVVRRLERRRTFDSLPAVVAFIERDVAGCV